MNKYIFLGLFILFAVLIALFPLYRNSISNSDTSQNMVDSTNTPSSDVSPGSVRPELGVAETEEECEQVGGVWQAWGLAGWVYCQVPAEDAGESCTSGSKCNLGSCITYDNSVPGECQTYPNTFGCFSYIEDNQVDAAICID